VVWKDFTPDDSSLSWSPRKKKRWHAALVLLPQYVARNNIRIEDMNMAKPEWWHYDDAHQCINMLCRGETPFMLVQTSKVIEMQFSRLTK
jgi:hypothetical protein